MYHFEITTFCIFLCGSDTGLNVPRIVVKRDVSEFYLTTGDVYRFGSRHILYLECKITQTLPLVDRVASDAVRKGGFKDQKFVCIVN